MKQYRYGMNMLQSECKIIYMNAYIQMCKVEDWS